MPPSKLIVTILVPPKGGFLIRGVFLLRGGDYIYTYIYIYIYYVFIDLFIFIVIFIFIFIRWYDMI